MPCQGSPDTSFVVQAAQRHRVQAGPAVAGYHISTAIELRVLLPMEACSIMQIAHAKADLSPDAHQGAAQRPIVACAAETLGSGALLRAGQTLGQEGTAAV